MTIPISIDIQKKKKIMHSFSTQENIKTKVLVFAVDFEYMVYGLGKQT